MLFDQKRRKLLLQYLASGLLWVNRKLLNKEYNIKISGSLQFKRVSWLSYGRMVAMVEGTQGSL